eukprot:SAG31_NODE_103_length_25164_cov_12.124317_29_plen_94_part_00
MAAEGVRLTIEAVQPDLETGAKLQTKTSELMSAPPAAQDKAQVTANHLKAISLVLVTLQTTGMVILTRFSRVGERKQYIVSALCSASGRREVP